jgi:hypothetical protein
MRKLMTAVTIALLVGACAKKDNGGENTMGGDTAAGGAMSHTDTTMTQSTVRDTTVVKTDTNVKKDTVKQTEHGTKKDSTKK